MIPGLILALVLNLQGLVDQMAQDHADRLATATSLFHSDLSRLRGPCEWAGEVIYRGSDPARRWAAYADSPNHNRIVNTARTHHGIGVVKVGDVYTVVDIFCREASPAPAPTPTTTAPRPPPTTTTTTQPVILVTKAPPLCPSRSTCVR